MATSITDHRSSLSEGQFVVRTRVGARPGPSIPGKCHGICSLSETYPTRLLVLEEDGSPLLP